VLNPMASAYKQFRITFGGTKNWLLNILHLLSYYIISASSEMSLMFVLSLILECLSNIHFCSITVYNASW
jgi:hypothetical protein